MNKLKSLILVLLFLLIACEPDDICLDSIEDTPKLILRFFDKETTKFKSVTNFQISSLDSDNSLFFGETDSIAIPLNHKTDLSNFNKDSFYQNLKENILHPINNFDTIHRSNTHNGQHKADKHGPQEDRVLFLW